MKISKNELREQLLEQGIIIDILEARINNYKQQIQVLKKSKFNHQKTAKI